MRAQVDLAAFKSSITWTIKSKPRGFDSECQDALPSGLMRHMCLPGQAELNDVAETIFPRPDEDGRTGKRASFPSPGGSTNKPSHFLLPRSRRKRSKEEVEQEEEGSKVRRRENSNSM